MKITYTDKSFYQKKKNVCIIFKNKAIAVWVKNGIVASGFVSGAAVLE